MAQHFMAVCMVCLLCADHLPCKEHLGGLNRPEKLDLELKTTSKGPDLSRVLTKGISEFPNLGDANHKPRSRLKRHSHHHGGAEDGQAEEKRGNENSRKYLAKIFEKFGDEKEMKIDFDGFENMLKHLGLTEMVMERIPNQPDGGKETKSSNAGNCITSLDFLARISPDVHKLANESIAGSSGRHNVSTDDEKPRTNNVTQPNLVSSSESDQTNVNKTLTANTTSSHSSSSNKSEKIDSWGMRKHISLGSDDLWNICPILLYQLTSKSGCIDPGALSLSLDGEVHDETVVSSFEDSDRTLVWLYASLSILGVSLCGLFGVAVIPCMETKFYHQILQFLVALAVGTLTGDALLHLMPHAMVMAVQNLDNNMDDIHTAMTFKGLVAVVAIILFFGTERALTMIAEWRKQRQKRDKLPSRVRVMRDPESTSLNNSEKLCKHKYSSYPYCYDEIAMDTKDDHHHHNNHEKGSSVAGGNSAQGSTIYKHNSVLPVTSKSLCDDALNADHHHHHHHNESLLSNNNGSILSSSGFKADRKESSASNHNNNNVNSDNNTMSTNLEDTSSIESAKMLKPMKHEESYTVILREHESKHHGHSHTHGHVHSPPSTLSAVAWMVVMGDGLHNFTDGMAIGAAFSNDLAGGFSTAIAVFCHELPHELGDFAVLLKAGMSARQAVYYNLLSSILSFFGMVLGVAIGDTPEASAWIFAIAAGLFIYIALVDMVPELTSSHQVKCAASTTLLQILGMSSGLLIMFLIAINEHDLKSLFTKDGQNHHHHH